MKLWIIGELNIFVLIHVNRYPEKLMHPQFFLNVRVKTPSAISGFFCQDFRKRLPATRLFGLSVSTTGCSRRSVVHSVTR